MVDLIGRKVKGFKFNGNDYSFGYSDMYMDEYIGKIGEITYISLKVNRCDVSFEDGANWSYPIELITEHLLPQYDITMIVEQPNDFKQITDSIASLLQYKNEKYGNSALNPLDIFNGKSKVGQRIDDKLARVKNSKELRKNDISDLLGYLTLVCQENNWTNFDEFKD